jgi:hypothetical protein
MKTNAPGRTFRNAPKSSEISRVDGPGHNGLQGEDDFRRHNERIRGHLGARGMAASSSNPDDEVVFAGHDASRPSSDVPRGHAGDVVRAENGIDGEAFEQSVLDHRVGSTTMFLGRLEDEADSSVEILRSGQDLSSPQQHRHMAVMSARVHATFVLGDVRSTLGGFRHRQRIHVGAQSDHPGALADRQACDHSGAPDLPMDVEAKNLECPGDVVCCAVLVKPCFRESVKVVAPLHQLVAQFPF